MNTHVDWVTNLRAQGLDPFPDDDWLRIYRTVYLAEVLAAGATLEQQARFVAGRLRDTLTVLRASAPTTPLHLPERRGPRRRAASRPDGGGDTPG
jgi:hypothetical protein